MIILGKVDWFFFKRVWKTYWNSCIKYKKIIIFQIEDAIMQQQVESYKHALRDWDEQQQRHRAALQQARASQLATSSNEDQSTVHTATTAWLSIFWYITYIYQSGSFFDNCYPLLSYHQIPFFEAPNHFVKIPTIFKIFYSPPKSSVRIILFVIGSFPMVQLIAICELISSFF